MPSRWNWRRLMYTITFLAGLGAALAIGLVTVARAGVGEWTTGGPGERISAVAVHPADDLTVLAAGASGVWRTTNGGGTWNKVGNRELGLSLERDPHDPNTLYATSADWSQILKSSDGGATWAAVYSTQRQMRDILVDPNTPNRIFISGTAPDGLAQIFRSNDGGATWKDLLPQDLRGTGGIGQTEVPALAALPGVKDLIFAGSTVYHGGRILRSTDGGDTWAAVYSGQLRRSTLTGS
jgi:photosystem II stability/assembly factor-like uncharacterized protein